MLRSRPRCPEICCVPPRAPNVHHPSPGLGGTRRLRLLVPECAKGKNGLARFQLRHAAGDTPSLTLSSWWSDKSRLALVLSALIEVEQTVGKTEEAHMRVLTVVVGDQILRVEYETGGRKEGDTDANEFGLTCADSIYLAFLSRMRKRGEKEQAGMDWENGTISDPERRWYLHVIVWFRD